MRSFDILQSTRRLHKWGADEFNQGWKTNMKTKLQSIVLVLIGFVLGCNEFIIVGILSDVSRGFNVSTSQAGFLVTLFALVYAFSTPIVNTIISQFNRFKVLVILMGIFIAGNTYTALAPSFNQLIASRVITALTAGPIISLAMSFATVIVSIQKRPMLVSWIFSGFSIASVVGVPVGTLIANSTNWRYSFLLITIIGLACLAAVVWLLPKHIKQTKSSLMGQLAIVRDRRVIIGSALVMCNLAGTYVVYTYLQPILTEMMKFSVASLGLLLAVYGVASIFSNQFSGFLASHGSLTRMPWVYIVQSVVFLMMPFFIHSQTLGFPLLLIMGMAMYLLNAPIQIHFMQIAESDYPQSMVLASSFNSIFSNLGISVGSAVGSAILSTGGLSALGIGAAVFAVASFGLVTYLVKITHHFIKTVKNKVA